MATQKPPAIEIPGQPYCYALLDGDQVFYVGKGIRGRIFAHERETLRDGISAKCDRIRAIWAEGRQVGYQILGTYSSHEEAYQAEKGWIAQFPGLTNIASGGGGMRLSAKHRIQRTSKRLLARMIPLSDWLERAPKHLLDACARVCGSAENFYVLMQVNLAQNAKNPAPNVHLIGLDGRLAGVAWE